MGISFTSIDWDFSISKYSNEVYQSHKRVSIYKKIIKSRKRLLEFSSKYLQRKNGKMGEWEASPH